MTFECFFKVYLVPFIPFAVALTVYLLGKSAYFTQKEYEMISKRYLEEGLDSISKSIDSSLATFRHNWWLSTVVLKHFRDLGKDMRPELYKQLYKEPDVTHFELWRDYRLQDIVGDDIFNRAHQSLDAFVKSSYAFFQDDLGAMVRVTLEGGKELEVKATREEMINEYLQQIENLDREAHRYYILLGVLQELTSIIQTERFSFDKLRELRSQENVKKAIEKLKVHFADTLDEKNE